MGKFMKRAVLESANSAYKIAKLNVLDSSTHVAPSEVDIGFAAKTTLGKVYVMTDNISCPTHSSLEVKLNTRLTV